jgi:hypothetical protein
MVFSMSEFGQHILVLLIVALCIAYVLWQAFGSFFGRRSSLGKCCENGCDPAKQATTGAQHFLPRDALARSRGKS